MSKKAQTRPERRETPVKRFSFTCGKCGARAVVTLPHYGKTECRCGLVFWALQPQRDGPLKLFLHPSSLHESAQ